MSGSITKRGKSSWRLKYDVPSEAGQRKTIFVTVRAASKREAERELRKRLTALDDGTHVDPSAETVASYFTMWLDQDQDLGAKTRERYHQLVGNQIIPHLGRIALQKLRPKDISAWHTLLLTRGGHEEKPLSARTVGHAHRVLHRGLARAVALEILSRNVASVASPPRVEEAQIEILTEDQIAEVLSALDGYGGRYGWIPFHALATVALGTAARRGELLALTWGAVDFKQCTVRIERSLEETADGIRVKTPKTRSGRRTIAISESLIEVLRQHRRRLIEHRLALGMGRLTEDDLAFPNPEGGFLSPDSFSRAWGHAMRDRRLPAVSFHSLRHSSASAMIAAGIDPVTVSKRLGHASPATTLRVYSHRFSAASDKAAAQAIEAALGAKR